MVISPNGSDGRGLAAVLHRAARLLLLALLLGAPAATSNAEALNQSTVVVSVEPAGIEVKSGEKFDFSITVSGVQDLGAFEVQVIYDPALVQVESAELGAFAGSTGRTVLPLGPTIDRSQGRVLAGVLTTGSDKGASGKGVLVKVSATALKAGSGSLELTGVRLTDTQGDVIAATAQGGQVKFTGDVIVPTATAAPVTPTSTPQPLPPTATRIPTLPPPAPTDTPAAATDTPVPTEPAPTETATPEVTLEPAETRIVRVATETAQAVRTTMAGWTPTPSATFTPEVATPTPTGTPAVEQPGVAASATPEIVQAATPAVPVPEQGGRNAIPWLIGGGVVVGAGVGALLLIRRRTPR